MQRLRIAEPAAPDHVARIAEALRGGSLAVLPTETVYGLAADPRNPAAVAALDAIKGRRDGQPYTHHLASSDALPRFATEPPARIRALLARYWPGPLTILLPRKGGAGVVGLRVPAHEATRRIIAACGDSLYLTSVNRSGQEPLCDPDAIERLLADEPRVAFLADAGPSRLGEPSAVVRLQGRELVVVRQGLLDADQLRAAAAAKVLFVCSGNTCRSPLAKVLAEKLVAEKLGIGRGEVAAHGLLFASAGTATLAGMPASAGSIAVAAEVGLDLAAHRSEPLTPASIAAADRIFGLSDNHVGAVLELAPAAAAKTALLHPEGKSIADPFGGPVEVYRSTRNEIAALLRRRLDELLAL